MRLVVLWRKIFLDRTFRRRLQYIQATLCGTRRNSYGSVERFSVNKDESNVGASGSVYRHEVRL
jgi:hypothetical protein